MARNVQKLQEVVRQRIRELRDERGLTQEQLCERAGISADAISRIEGGSRVPTLETLERLSGARLPYAPSAFFEGAPRPLETSRPNAVRRLLAVLDGQPDEVQRLAADVVAAVVRAFAAGRRLTPEVEGGGVSDRPRMRSSSLAQRGPRHRRRLQLTTNGATLDACALTPWP